MSDSRKKQAAAVEQPSIEKGYRAVGKSFRSPPDKVRIMGRTVLGMPAEKAIEILRLTPNRSAQYLWRLVKSAAYNAYENYAVDLDKLWVHRIWVDRAQMIKRYHPCAHGRAKPILKRSCHITVQLEWRK
jgi:large subunit ribosomal protein L22